MSDNQPLNIHLDLSKIKTALPLIQECMTKVRLEDITENQRDGATIVKMEFHLTEGAPSEDGSRVNAGFPIFVNFDTSQVWLQQKLAKFIDGLLGTGDEGNKKGKPARPDFGPELLPDLIGREAIAKVVITRSKKSDYVGNDITSLTFLGDVTI
jgi:hypothetical protein